MAAALGVDYATFPSFFFLSVFLYYAPTMKLSSGNNGGRPSSWEVPFFLPCSFPLLIPRTCADGAVLAVGCGIGEMDSFPFPLFFFPSFFKGLSGFRDRFSRQPDGSEER